jgi:hypothetical protein
MKTLLLVALVIVVLTAAATPVALASEPGQPRGLVMEFPFQGLLAIHETIFFPSFSYFEYLWGYRAPVIVPGWSWDVCEDSNGVRGCWTSVSTAPMADDAWKAQYEVARDRALSW